MPPPASDLQVAMANNHSGTGLHFLLGVEYERKKQKLQEELQMDYKRYIDQKRDSHAKAGVYNKSQVYGSSLPIAERISEKEKLREERKREYNLFLQEQAKTKKGGEFSVHSKPEEPTDVGIVHKHEDHSPPESYRLAEPSTSRKDAATLRSKNGRKTWDLRHHRQRAFLSRQENSDSYEEKFNSDSGEEISHRRKTNRQSYKSKYKKEVKDHRAKRVPFNIKYDEVFFKNNNDQNWTSKAPHKQDKKAVAERPTLTTTAETHARVFATGLLIGHSEEQDTLQKKKEQYKQELLSQISEQRENKRKEKILELKVAATGATDPQRPDIFRQFGPEHYTHEKWNQKASYKPESGAITGRDNPELKNFPDSSIRMEHRKPPRRPTLAVPSPTRDDNLTPKSGANHGNYSPDTSLEEYNKSFSHMIGDLTTKRVSPVSPPLPPRVNQTYKTPHDEAYNYYDKPEEHQEFEGSTLPLQKGIKQPRWPTQSVPDFGQRITVIPLRDPASESDRQSRENYQEALKQQVKDKAERRRREREERELYDAKKVNEMMVYNPWGRAGGGAPLFDQSGNLITDLDQMHKLNEENYRNSNLNGSFEAPQAKHGPPLPGLKQSGYMKKQEDLKRQDHYKECLRQQIEENRRKQAEDRERQKILEEKEEKRLAEERARILKEYEEEQQKNRRKMQLKTDDKLLASEGTEHHKGQSRTDKPDKGRKEVQPPSRERTTQKQREPQLTHRGYNGSKQEHYKESIKEQVEEKRQKQAEEREQIIKEEKEKSLAAERANIMKEYEEDEQRNRRKMQGKLWTNENNQDKEKNKTQRGPSPSILNIHHTSSSNTDVPSSPSAKRRLSPRTDHLEEAPQNHPEQVLGQKPHRQDEQEVITELGTLRRILEKKKKHLETKLMQTDPVNEYYFPVTRHQGLVRPARGDTALQRHREHVQFPTQRLHSTQENMQNLREFNQLKHRDTSSREEVLRNYPDPPTDGPTLDIQQQALLREQWRRLELMKRRDMEYFWDKEEDLVSNRNLSKEPVKLPADTLFLDVYSCEEDFPCDPSAGSQLRSTHPRRHDFEEEAIHEDKIDHFEPDVPSQSSNTTINKVQQRRRHERPSDHRCSDEGDLFSGRSSRSARERPVSVGTVAMEPWLQTSTEPEYSGSKRPGRRPPVHL